MGKGDAGNASRNMATWWLSVMWTSITRTQAAGKFHQQTAARLRNMATFGKLLERDDVHAIVQGAPDHWHTLINIAAAKARKDVYGEKPLTLTIDEGKHVLQAVRENKVVFQTGTQQRSSSRFRLACELVRNGRIGPLKEIHVFVPAGIRGGPFKAVPVPDGFNYDFWLGQAPLSEYFTERCHSNFRWWYDYSGGPVTDWGAHHNDIARWGSGLMAPWRWRLESSLRHYPTVIPLPSSSRPCWPGPTGSRRFVKTTDR